MNKQDKNKQMQVLEAKIDEAISAAEEFADKHSLGFNISPAYGMGGYYDGETCEWMASSQGC